MLKFPGMSSEHRLVDMGFDGPKFTWTRGNDGNMFKGARLDRVLCNMEWRILFKTTTVNNLPKFNSDHAHVLIHLSGEQHIRSQSYFRFQAAWMMHPGFKSVVESSWRSQGPLPEKIAHLNTALAKWNKDHFGNIFRKKRSL